MNQLLGRAALLAMLAMTACAPAATQTQSTTGGAVAPSEVRDEVQTLKVASGVMVGNPTPQSSRTNVYQFWPMYDNLTQFGPNYEVRPSVAEKWSVSADGLVWTFNLRKDMKWPTGDALTAEDAAFTMNEIADKKWPELSYLEGMTEAKAVDANTLEIRLKNKNAAIPNGGPYLWIIPKKYYQQVGFDGFVQKPMGSGPYELTSFQAANQMTYKKRAEPHAFRKPIANEIQIKLIPEVTQIINGLNTGEIDIAANVGLSGDQANALKKNGIVVTSKLNNSAQFALPQGSWELRDTPLKDKRVRMAMNYATNKDAMATGLFGGYAEPTGQLAVPGSDYADPSVKPYPYDVATAKKLLAEAGYPNGFKLAGGLDFSNGRGEQNLIIAFQADMKAIGIEFDLISNEESVFVDKAYGRRDLPKGDIWSGSNGEDNGFFTGVRTFYGCGKPVGGPDRSKLYCNPEWDKMMDAAYGEADPAKRRTMLQAANKIFRDDVPVVYTISKSVFLASTTKIRGVDIPTPNTFNFDAVYKVK